MTEQFKTIALRFLRPKAVWVALLTTLAAAALFFIFTTSLGETALAYAVYVFSAYVMTVLAFRVPGLLRQTKALIHSNRLSKKFITDVPFRTIVSLYFSLTVNLLFAVFKLVTAVIYSSLWFGAVAGYYLLLCVVRVLLLRHLQNSDCDLRRELQIFRFCGVLLIILNFALGAVAYHIIHGAAGYAYPGTMIYAVALYAFYCLTMSIIGSVKYRGLDHPLLSASKALNLATALVAMFTLQTAMFAAFASEMDGQLIFIMNTVTGGAVCLATLITGVQMAVRATRRLHATGIKNG